MKSIFGNVFALTLVVVLVSPTSGQFYSPTYNLVGGSGLGGNGYGFPVTPGVVHDPNAPEPKHLAHRAVVENAAAEAQLPPELINPFYKNPRIAEGLAKESWFGDKEFPVFNRQADKIPREEIVKIIRRIQHQRR